MEEERSTPVLHQDAPDTSLPSAGPSSRWRDIVSIACLAITGLLLLDAAVETSFSGAAIVLRLLIAVLVVLFVALHAVLWKRVRWEAKALASVLFLLVLVALTAWLPGGLDNGVVIARQATSSVLEAIVGFAVLIAGVCFMRLHIPFWLRLIAVVLAAYGLAALGFALLTHQSFASLFHGQSLWTRAPFWLQGALIGVVVLPLAALGNVITVALGRHHAPARKWHWELDVSLVLVAGIGAAGIMGHDFFSPLPVSGPNGPNPVAPGPIPSPRGNTDSTSFDLVLQENGGNVESITGDDVFGTPLIDGDLRTVSWTHPPMNAPTDIVLSFYKRQSALVSAVAVTAPDPGSPQAQEVQTHLASWPKQVEVWATKTDDNGYQKIGDLTFATVPSTQTLMVPAIEARFVKIRVLSLQRDPFEYLLVGISEIQVFEGRRRGYVSLHDRSPDLAQWKGSPRYAAQRGIKWLEPATVRWQQEKKCFGCHIQAQSVMGLAIAKKNNYIVNDAVIKKLSDFTETQQHADGSYFRDPGEPSTQFAAMGLAYYDDLADITHNSTFLKSVDWLVAKQTDNGQLPYSRLGCVGDAVVQGPMMATANTLLAFRRAYTETSDLRYKEAADRALGWIESTQPISTQDEVFKLLALTKFGGPDQKPAVQSLVERLITEARPNGGWRECPDHQDLQDPNPFSTGQVLYAFKQAGVSVSSSPFIKGVKYLLSVQQWDGSWRVDGHVLHGQGAPYAPSMWAIIGLAGSFGDVQTGGLQIVAETDPAKAVGAHNLEIILDVSGSMNSKLGNSTRIDTARDVLRGLLAKIPDDFNVGLRVYAHRYSYKDLKHSCTDTELLVPIQKLDRQRIGSTVASLKPRGDTPLIYAVRQTPADLKPVGGGSVIVITDGQETCSGNDQKQVAAEVEKAIAELKTAGVPVTLNIVGFTLSGKEKKDVEQVMPPFAEATGGQYYYAENGEALARALSVAALNKFPYEVFNDKGEQVAKGEAGPLSEALPAGTYKVVVHAGEQELSETVAVSKDANTVLKVTRKGEQFVLERERSQAEEPLKAGSLASQ